MGLSRLVYFLAVVRDLLDWPKSEIARPKSEDWENTMTCSTKTLYPLEWGQWQGHIQRINMCRLYTFDY